MRSLYSVFALGIALLLVGCEGDQGPAGPLLSGSLSGFVSLYDDEGDRVANCSGVAITLDGTTSRTVTDSTGRWQLDGLPTGTYTIVYTKDGYFEERVEELQFLGGGTFHVARVGMYRFPTFEVIGLTVTGTTGSDAITTEGTVSALIPSWRPVLVVYGLTRGVSVASGTHVFFHESYAYPGVQTFRSTIYLDGPTRSYYGLPSGTWLYVRAYPAGLGPLSRYDVTTGSYEPFHYGPTASPLDSVLIP